MLWRYTPIILFALLLERSEFSQLFAIPQKLFPYIRVIADIELGLRLLVFYYLSYAVYGDYFVVWELKFMINF